MNKSSKDSWVQILDYEWAPSRCRRCFKTGHAAAHCGLEKKKMWAWGNGASDLHYIVMKKSDKVLVGGGADTCLPNPVDSLNEGQNVAKATNSC